MAVTLALSVLLALTAPMLALLSACTFEPVMARNLIDATRALYIAEAGIEWALTRVVDTPIGSDANLALELPAGLLPRGTIRVTTRQQPSDSLQPTSVPTARMVIVTSTGTVDGAQRTIEVVVQLPPASGQAAPETSDTAGRLVPVSWRER
jgi:Tfp pilus assembly protein PilX